MKKIEEELICNSGRLFDRMVIETLLQILRERKEYALVNSAEKITVEQCEYAFVDPEPRRVMVDKPAQIDSLGSVLVTEFVRVDPGGGRLEQVASNSNYGFPKLILRPC